MAVERMLDPVAVSRHTLPPSPAAPGSGRSAEPRPRANGLTAPELALWSRLVADQTGLYFPPERVHQLQLALSHRVAALGVGSVEAYRMLLAAFHPEWVELAAELTVGETRFFRQPEVFRSLEKDILPAMLHDRCLTDTQRLRVWCAGCSSGEEPWSIAMLFADMAGMHALKNIEILATDVNYRAIETARRGEYHASKASSLNEKRRSGYFTCAPDAGLLHVKPVLREFATFVVHNLAGQGWPSGRFDLVICQNVLMYLLPDLRTQVIERLYRSLAPRGCLILGPSEFPVEPLMDGARPVNRSGILSYSRTQGGADGIAGRP